MDTCETCEHWTAESNGDMGICNLISTGQTSEALTMGQDAEMADFLCAPTFGCSLWSGGGEEMMSDELPGLTEGSGTGSETAGIGNAALGGGGSWTG